MKKYRKVVVLTSVLITVCSSITLSILASSYSKKSLNMMIEESVFNTMNSIEKSVQNFNKTNFDTIHIASSLPIIKDPKIPVKEKAQQLFNVKDANPNLVGLNITDLKGDSYLVEGPLYNFSERDYFKNALKGKETVFGPIINKVTNVPTIFYGAPHYDYDGNLTNTFFLAVHGEYLSEICNQNSENGKFHTAIIKRSTGLVIASPELSKVLKDNIYDDAAESGNASLEEMTGAVSAGETGFKIINIGNRKVINGYMPIEGTDWSIIIETDYFNFDSKIRPEFISLILTSGLIIIASFLLSLIVSVIVFKKQPEAK